MDNVYEDHVTILDFILKFVCLERDGCDLGSPSKKTYT